MSGASAIGVPGWPDFACCTASIDSVRMQLIDNWSNCALVISRGEFAGLAIAFIFPPPVLRWCRAARLLRGPRAATPDPGGRLRLEWIDRRRAGARALRPSRGRSRARARAGTG